MFTSPALLTVGRALLGYTADEKDIQPIGIRQQHDILKAATVVQIIAAKVAIERFYPMQTAAILLADCYLSAKTRQNRAA